MESRDKKEHNKKFMMQYAAIHNSQVTEEDIRKFTDNEVYIQSVMAFRRSFTDYRIMVEDITAQDDFVIVHGVARGTHSAEFYGIPATFKSIEFQVIVKYQVANDKIVNAWPMHDSLVMMEQLGIINERL